MASSVVDVDSHVLEPSDLWENYLEPEYRSRALRIKKDEKGLEYLEIDGNPSRVQRGGTLSNITAAGKEDLEHFLSPGAVPYEEARDLAPAGKDAGERVKWLDQEGVDSTLLYPSFGLDWPQDCKDAKLAAAYCRAYNNWLHDFCQGHPGRLIPLAHLSLIEVEEGVKELKRTAKMGFKGAYPPGYSINGIPYADSYFDPFWAEAQEIGIPISLHVTGNVDGFGGNVYDKSFAGSFWWFLATDMGDIIVTFTSLFQGGLFDKFPNLKLPVVETGSGWLPYWLERLDSLYDKLSFATPMKMRPSEYFQRQCWIVAEPDESTVPATVQHLGADKVLWGSDFPHTEGEPAGALQDLKEHMTSMPAGAQSKILGENAVKLYSLN